MDQTGSVVRSVERVRDAPARPAGGQLAWLIAAAVLAGAVPAFFVGVLRLPRNIYLFPYIAFVAAVLYGWVRWSRLDVAGLFRAHWQWGLLGAAAVAVFASRTVLEQPGSARSAGLDLVRDLLWPGLTYGAADGLLLSVFPVVCAWQAARSLGWTDRWPGRIGAGALALLASLLVIATYHLGYPECRGPQVFVIIAGVGIQSLVCIITGSPLPAVLGHIAMHITAVWHGMESVAQLPPHYEKAPPLGAGRI